MEVIRMKWGKVRLSMNYQAFSRLRALFIVVVVVAAGRKQMGLYI